MTLARHLRNEADSLRLELTATRRALWAVRVLDAWGTCQVGVSSVTLDRGAQGTFTIVAWRYDGGREQRQLFHGDTPDAARLAAAEAVFPDLPESERARLGVRP